MVRLPTLNVNWSRDRVYAIRRGVVACCILFCLIGAGVETAAAQRSWPRADTASAAATAAANEPTAVTRKQVPDSGKQGGSRKTQNTQNGDDKAAQSVDWKGPTGKQPDLSQYSDLSVEVSLAKQRGVRQVRWPDHLYDDRQYRRRRRHPARLVHHRYAR